MAKITFEIGDKVQLNSGGPIMTVASVAGGKVECTWFDQQNKPYDKTYSPAALKLAQTGANTDGGDPTPDIP